jgi:hypothetical protein
MQRFHDALDPVERFGEVVFGLIMVLTFTGSLSAAEGGRAEVRMMLIGALGCSIAWGLVDSVMYLMGTKTERERGAAILRALRGGATEAEGRRLIAGALPKLVASVLTPEELESTRRKLAQLPEAALNPSLRKDDLLGAFAVFCWVVAATIPVLVPFLFVHDPIVALRISNGIAIVMLFVTGLSLGHHAKGKPWRFGLAMVVIGVFLVAVTIALGG